MPEMLLTKPLCVSESIARTCLMTHDGQQQRAGGKHVVTKQRDGKYGGFMLGFNKILYMKNGMRDASEKQPYVLVCIQQGYRFYCRVC